MARLVNLSSPSLESSGSLQSASSTQVSETCCLSARLAQSDPPLPVCPNRKYSPASMHQPSRRPPTPGIREAPKTPEFAHPFNPYNSVRRRATLVKSRITTEPAFQRARLARRERERHRLNERIPEGLGDRIRGVRGSRVCNILDEMA